MRNKTKALLSVMLCATLLCGVAPLGALASAGMEKEEVIYATLDFGGSLRDAYVVNILHGSGDIIDYGDYTAVRNMTTGDALTLDAGKVTGSTEAELLFYEGMLEDTELPWIIDIRYTLDGEPCEATDLPGRSGALALDISTRKNEACVGDFYDRYALQIALSLDFNLFQDIQAGGATIANVGGNKQLTYTVLPGKDKDIHITADVVDFRMDGISINGMELNLGLDLDHTEMEDRVDEMMDGIDSMQKGADDLMEGVADMRTAVRDDLLDAAITLTEGAIALQEGAAALEVGIASMSKMADADTLLSSSLQMMDLLQSMQAALAGVSIDSSDLESLTEATAQLQLGLDALWKGMEAVQSGLGYPQYKAALAAEGLDIDALVRGNTRSIETLTAQAAEAEQALATLPEGKEYAAQRDQLQAQLTQAATLGTLLTGNNAALGGIEMYLDQVSLAVDELYTGLGELRGQYAVYSASISTMADTLSALLEKSAELTEQAVGLSEQYATLEQDTDMDTAQSIPSISEGYAQLAAGAEALASGSVELAEGMQALQDGVDTLYESIGELYSGTVEMSDGTTEMKEKVDTAYADITEEIDDLLDIVSGGEGYATSFVSPRNSAVQSVQFVLRTDALEQEEAEKPVIEEEEERTFWEKLTGLFK